MVTQEPVVESLLREIRDSLRIIAEAMGPQYRAAVAERLASEATSIRDQVKTESQWNAVLAMDGAHTRREVSQMSGMDPGNLSRFIARLADAGLLERDSVEARGGLPKMIFARSELQALRAVSR